MTETDAVNSKAGEAAPQDITPEKATSPLEIKLIEDTKIALELPIPEKNDYWNLSIIDKTKKGKRRLLPFLKKQELTEEDLSQLRDTANRAPGRAKVKIQDLLKTNAGNADLMMLFALCSYRMVLNTSNRKGALEGLKSATKEAANALLADGISLYNCEKFFDIYFEYLNRLKRFQISTFKSLGETIRQQDLKKNLEIAIRMCDNLIEEKNRVIKVLNQIKGKFKSSSFSIPWEFSQIKLAGKKVEQSDYRFVCGPAEARQLVVYVMAMLDVFARVPILTSLVDALLQLIPEGAHDLYLRKASIQSRRAFTQLELLLKEGDRDRIRTFGKQVYKTTCDNLQQIANHHVKQGFEADPYFNLCRITIMTFGLYKAEDQNEMLLKSVQSIKRLGKLDMTKEKVFAQTATKFETKLSSLMVESRNPGSS